MASLYCVSGSTLHISCSHAGNTSIEKKVPESIICGKPNRLISNGMAVSFLAMLLKISPTPINKNNMMIVMIMISKNVSKP
jgi:hypothetical protein